ncbi:MAG TPA: DUF6292 family protein [Pseudonocardia sp.]|nr:DUF6292 family protein [Pseudonocardia sp.]
MPSNLTARRAQPESADRAGSTVARPQRSADGPGDVRNADVEDLPDLVAAYLSAVANCLAERNLTVRALRVDETEGNGTRTLTGHLTLVPGAGHARWAPSSLRWDEHTGWSAVLRHTVEPGLGAVSRHLTGQLVPAPLIVAHFVSELDGDPNTIWATALEQHPALLDRRCLAMELSGYAYP